MRREKEREREKTRVREGRRPAARPSAYRRRWLFPLSIQSSSTLCASIRWPFRYISESGLGFVPGRVLLMESFNRRQILLFWIRRRSLVVGRERCLMQVGDGLCGGDVPRVFARTVADVISLRRLIYPIKITHEVWRSWIRPVTVMQVPVMPVRRVLSDVGAPGGGDVAGLGPELGRIACCRE
ncbi:hypothetical protein HID58_023125 [Brassica napus]|uniref:Uncharacterized protein n=1 Tax=Brassica napus TaxID=3708 RepID=A0ABQ8D241_BRANA|nr:hypothetical protein HID58_023125 [Brassica napus]